MPIKKKLIIKKVRQEQERKETIKQQLPKNYYDVLAEEKNKLKQRSDSKIEYSSNLLKWNQNKTWTGTFTKWLYIFSNLFNLIIKTQNFKEITNSNTSEIQNQNTSSDLIFLNTTNISKDSKIIIHNTQQNTLPILNNKKIRVKKSNKVKHRAIRQDASKLIQHQQDHKFIAEQVRNFLLTLQNTMTKYFHEWKKEEKNFELFKAFLPLCTIRILSHKWREKPTYGFLPAFF